MNAIVLAGGFGSRLRPLTDSVPKPMLKIANVPMLDYVVAWLVRYGFNDLVFTLGYLPEVVRDFVSGYKGINCRFKLETEPLGTAGAVKNADDCLDDVFVVASGDALSNIDLDKMLDFHFRGGADVTMACSAVQNPRLYGVVNAAEDGTINGFIEKPDTLEYGNLVNAGVYVMNKSVLEEVPRGVKFDFSRDLFPSLVAAGRIKAFVHRDYWCDIGDKLSYYKANFFMKDGGFYPSVPSFSSERYASTLKSDSLVSNSAVTVGGAFDSIIGEGARVASSAEIADCVVLDGALVTGRHKFCIIGADFVVDLPELWTNTGNYVDKNDKIFQTGI